MGRKTVERGVKRDNQAGSVSWTGSECIDIKRWREEENRPSVCACLGHLFKSSKVWREVPEGTGHERKGSMGQQDQESFGKVSDKFSKTNRMTAANLFTQPCFKDTQICRSDGRDREWHHIRGPD
jgi:hypothetical protein